LLVLDEPVAALDVSIQAQILNLLSDLREALGLSMLFVAHDLSVVRHMATRIGVLYLGRLVEVAEAKTLFRAPEHPYTRMLLDAVPDLALSGRRRKPVSGEIPNPISPPPGCAFHPRCRYATDLCRHESPPLRPLDDGSRTVACHVAQGVVAAGSGVHEGKVA
jgi:peptide/nickel transport system ATP-binding protein